MSTEPLLPWLPAVASILDATELPDLSGSELLIGWDSREANGFSVDGFVCTNRDSRNDWDARQAEIRSRYKLDDRVIEYKALSKDDIRWSALNETLESAIGLSGLCLVTLISHRLLDHRVAMVKESLGAGKVGWSHDWKPLELARASRLAVTVPWLTSRFAVNGQDVSWRCDEDNIWSNEATKRDMETMLSLASRHQFGQLKPGRLSYGTYMSGGVLDILDKEFTCIPDLFLGGVSDSLALFGENETALVLPMPPTRGRALSKQEVIMDYFWTGRAQGMRCIAVKVDIDATGQIVTKEVSVRRA